MLLWLLLASTLAHSYSLNIRISPSHNLASNSSATSIAEARTWQPALVEPNMATPNHPYREPYQLPWGLIVGTSGWIGCCIFFICWQLPEKKQQQPEIDESWQLPEEKQQQPELVEKRCPPASFLSGGSSASFVSERCAASPSSVLREPVSEIQSVGSSSLQPQVLSSYATNSPMSRISSPNGGIAVSAPSSYVPTPPMSTRSMTSASDIHSRFPALSSYVPTAPRSRARSASALYKEQSSTGAARSLPVINMARPATTTGAARTAPVFNMASPAGSMRNAQVFSMATPFATPRVGVPLVVRSNSFVASSESPGSIERPSTVTPPLRPASALSPLAEVGVARSPSPISRQGSFLAS